MIIQLKRKRFKFDFRVKGTYGKDEKFTFILSLVFFLCIFNTIVSKISKKKK
jgi:hypothetical protein